MMWTCGPCNANGHDRCAKTQPDPLAKINQMLGLPAVDMWCACEHISHGLVAPAAEPKTRWVGPTVPSFDATLAELLEVVICDGHSMDMLSRYADTLIAAAEVVAPEVAAAHRTAGLTLRQVLFMRVTEGVLSS